LGSYAVDSLPLFGIKPFEQWGKTKFSPNSNFGLQLPRLVF
jgi:hypothetical protein